MFHTLHLLGLTRKLPILKTPSGIYIAGFNPVGDTELLMRSGETLANLAKSSSVKADVVLTTELKGVPIAQEVARALKLDYVALRKDAKCYMLNPHQTNGSSITSGKTNYFISEPDLGKLKGKNVLFVDDVFSTGSTFKSMLDFAEKENFNIVAGLSILKEGGEANLSFKFNNVPIFSCGYLPLPKVQEISNENKGELYE